MVEAALAVAAIRQIGYEASSEKRIRMIYMGKPRNPLPDPGFDRAGGGT